MDTLRRRVPFKAEDNDIYEHILDEQEQEDVIRKIRSENATSNTQYRILLQVVLGLSLLLQFIFLLTPSRQSPLLALFPHSSPSNSASAPLPASTILTSLSIALHINLVLVSQPAHILNRLNIHDHLPKLIPFDIAYALSAVAPSLSFFMQKPWQTITWWSITPAIIFITQTVVDAIELGNHNVAEVEAMKYVAPGA